MPHSELPNKTLASHGLVYATQVLKPSLKTMLFIFLFPVELSLKLISYSYQTDNRGIGVDFTLHFKKKER